MRKKVLFIMTLTIFFVFLVNIIWFNLYRFVIPNQTMKNANSVFLQSHQRDLVKWRLFNKETIDYAKKVDKPLFIFIGYASSQFSRAMQEDSFTDPFVSKIINRHFVPVLVDRNKNYQLSRIYTNVCSYHRKFSGWPLTIMATTDGVPLFIDTHVRKKNLIQYLNHMRIDWKKSKEESLTFSNNWLIKYQDDFNIDFSQQVQNPNSYLKTFIKSEFDMNFGSLDRNVKFPHYLRFSQLIMIDRSYLPYAKQTLDQIITSPMFDFTDGGVHRYSLHPEWLSPNFEMTLIDQIHFMRILIQIYLLTGSTTYLDVAEFNLSFVLNQFKNSNGLFSSARYEKGFPGSYYFFETDFLDSISPLDFLRVPIDDTLNLVAMVKPNDIQSVGRSKLKTKRLNSKFNITNDLSISPKEQALLLEFLLQMKETIISNVYDEQINNLMFYFRKLSFVGLELLDLLIIYDVLIKIEPQPNLDSLIKEIKLHLTDQFPFIKSIDFLPPGLQPYDYYDGYNSNQPLYYILLHKDQLLSNYEDGLMCRDIKGVITRPWHQLSLVRLLKNKCN